MSEGHSNDLDFPLPIEIREIPKNRKYWFVRTFGGKLFDYYYEKNRIGISGNSVPVPLVKIAKHDEVAFSSLQNNILQNIFPEKPGEATKLANQLIDFYHNMKEGDIVLMPSENSDFIAFGEVTSEMKLLASSSRTTFYHNDKLEEYPQKIRSVKWLKIMAKRDVVGDLRNLFSTHMGLTNADQYADFIEGNLSTFFLKDDQYFSTLCIDLNEDQDLNAFELFRYLEALTKLYEDVCISNGIEYNEELYLKIKVQSPGNLILKVKNSAKTTGGKVAIAVSGTLIIGFLGMVALSVSGSDPKVELSQKADGSIDFTAGVKGNIFDNIQNAKDREQKRESKRIEDSLAHEDKKFEQYLKRKEHGALTAEDRAKYGNQMIDSAKALNMSSIESKAVKKEDID